MVETLSNNKVDLFFKYLWQGTFFVHNFGITKIDECLLKNVVKRMNIQTL